MDTDALQRLDAFLSDPAVPQEDKNRAVAMARVQDQTDTPMSRAGQYLTRKGSEFVGALQGVQKDIQNVVTGQPYGAGFPGQRSGWETAGDVLTTAAPVAQIMGGPVSAGIGLAGYGAGAAGRAAGMSEQEADVLNLGTQAVGGLGQAVVGAGKAVAGAPAALKAAAQGKYGVAATGAAGKTLAMGTQAGDQFAQDLNTAIEWAGTHPLEAKMAQPLLNKLTTPGSPGVTYSDLDNALIGLRKIPGVPRSYVRQLIDEAAQGLVEGTPAGAARTAAKAMWTSLRAKPFQTAGGLSLGVAGGETAAHQIGRGEYKKAAGTLALTALGGAGLRKLTPRGIGAAVSGAAGPLARTAVAVGGPAVRGLTAEGTPEAAADLTAPEPAAPEEAPSPTQARIPIPAGPYGQEIAAVSSLAGVPTQLIQAHMKLESSGNPNAVGDQGRSIGLMQIQPGTFAVVAPQASKLLGRTADIRNPLDNLLAGGLLLRRYLDKTNGDWHAAAQMYNGGEGTSGNAHTRWYAGEIGKNLSGAIRETPLEPLTESGTGG